MVCRDTAGRSDGCRDLPSRHRGGLSSLRRARESCCPRTWGRRSSGFAPAPPAHPSRRSALRAELLSTGAPRARSAPGRHREPFLCLSASEVQLGTVPGNQRRTAGLTVTNAGEGTLSWRLENLPSYVSVTPAAGSTASRSVVSISVGPTDMSPKTYQNLVRVTSDGGEQFVTIRFTITEAAPVRIDLTVGSKTVLVGGVKVALDAPAFIDAKSGRTFVPVRMISEAFGAQVTWNEVQQKVWLEARCDCPAPCSARRPAHRGQDGTGERQGRHTGSSPPHHIKPHLRSHCGSSPRRSVRT